MTHEEIIAMAREAGISPNQNPKAINALAKSVPLAWLVDFATLVAAKEREACAQYMESCGRHGHAAAIRTRARLGEQT